MKKAYKKTEKYKAYAREYEKTRIRVYDKSYWENKKNIRTCICGSEYNYGKTSNRNSHYRSQKHQKHVALIFAKLRGE